MHKLSQHIVIVGWNLKGPQIIRTLRGEAQYQNATILVMADLDHKPIDDPLLVFTRSTYPIRGEAVDRACLPSAATIVVLANYAEKQNADALTAINCMVARHANRSARIIAELLDPVQRIYIEEAGADQVVGIGEVGGFLLAEATIDSEKSKELLAFVAKSGRPPTMAHPWPEPHPAALHSQPVSASE